MRKIIKLSSALALPLETITQTIGILAKRGAGKTYTASVLAEEFIATKLPFCVLDPTGAWWGLRVLADGKPGLPVVIIGGKHGDIPLEPTGGKLIADLIVDNPGFYILDLSLFDSNANQDRFATDFAERLYRRKQVSREPLHLFVDEADSFAPQRPYKGQERMLGAFEALSRRGRLYGIGITLISQRAAVINKNVLSQIEVLIALQTTAPQDRDAIEAWAEGHGTPAQVKELMGSLASLGLGEAWIWSPSWLELFKRIQIRRRITFNSSATPKIGEVRREPKALAPVDIEKLRKEMAETIERVKADDPRSLKKQIAELKKENTILKKNEPQKATVKIERIEVPTVGKRALEGIKEAEKKGRIAVKAIKEYTRTIEESISKLTAELSKVRTPQKIEKPITEKSKKPIPVRFYEKEKIENNSMVSLEMGKGERVVLSAVAQHAEGITREHLTVLTGYKSSSRNTYLQRLQQRGYVRAALGVINITDEGIQSLGNDYAPLPEGEELREYLMKTLPEGERRILGILINSYPAVVDREMLSTETGYAPSSRNTYLQRLTARQLVEFEGRGAIKASEKLFV